MTFYYTFCYQLTELQNDILDAFNARDYARFGKALLAYSKFSLVQSFTPSMHFKFYKQIFQMGFSKTMLEGVRG